MKTLFRKFPLHIFVSLQKPTWYPMGFGWFSFMTTLETFFFPLLVCVTAKRSVRRFVARDEGEGVIRFTEEELNTISELERGPNYIEVTCGCTNKKYGDYIGKLRISSFGHFKITCTCSEKCKQGKSHSLTFSFSWMVMANR